MDKDRYMNLKHRLHNEKRSPLLIASNMHILTRIGQKEPHYAQ